MCERFATAILTQFDHVLLFLRQGAKKGALASMVEAA